MTAMRKFKKMMVLAKTMTSQNAQMTYWESKGRWEYPSTSKSPNDVLTRKKK
jgi:hypothetical protein